MRRRLAAVGLGMAAFAAILASRRRFAPPPGADGGLQRTERLRREIEEARRRLRKDLARTRGE